MSEIAIIDYAAKPLKPPSHRGQGALSIAAALVLPGFGHLLARDNRSAARWMVGSLGLSLLSYFAVSIPSLFPFFIVLGPLVAIVNLGSLPFSYLSGRRSSHYVVPHPVARYLLATVVGSAACFGSPNVIIVDLVRKHLVEAFVTSSISMLPTMQAGDRFVVHKQLTPARWNVVVFDSPFAGSGPYVMRIVGLPGEKVEIIDEAIHVNGVAIPAPQSYLKYAITNQNFEIRGPGCTGNPITLGLDEYYILGDNSPRAADSRYWRSTIFARQDGAVPAANIRGVATWIYWPPSRWGRVR